MKAPRLELPPSPRVSVPLTPRGISPRTLLYISHNPSPPLSCQPGTDAAEERSPALDVTLTLGPSPGSQSFTSTSSSELLIRSSCSPSSDTSFSPSDSYSLSSTRSLSASDKLGPLPEDDSEAASPKIPRFNSFSRLRLSSKDCNSRKSETGGYMGMSVKLSGPLSPPEGPLIARSRTSPQLTQVNATACHVEFEPPGLGFDEEDIPEPSLICDTPRGRPGPGFGRSISRAPFSDGSITLQPNLTTKSTTGVSSSFSSESFSGLDRERSESDSAAARSEETSSVPFGPFSIDLSMPHLPTGRPRIVSSRSVDIGDVLGFNQSRSLERKSSDPNSRRKSPDKVCHEPRAPPGLPRFPSLSRLRLSSREPDGTLPSSRPVCKLPPQLVTSVSGITTGGSPKSRRAFGLASLKRKRPPMLDIPLKDSFASSPLSTPEPSSENSVEDIRELMDDGIGYSVLCKRGRRREVMEDRFQAAQELGGESRTSFFGVYDGHGGTAAADFVAKHLHLNVADSLKKRDSTPEEAQAAMVDAFMETDRQFLKKGVHSGASCVACLVTSSEAVIAHAGDCRAVMRSGGETICLTEDHKASRQDERERIEALGGHVDDFTGTWRVQGIMAVTRGIGDQHLKEYITPVPETRVVKWKSKDDFIIMASDGLWDVVENDEATSLVSAVLNPGPRRAAVECDNLAPQLQALLSPTNSPAGSPILPLPKRGFRSSSFSGDEMPAMRERKLPETYSLKLASDDGATSERSHLRCHGSSDKTHTTMRLTRACRKLADLAVKRGSSDDISALIVLPGTLQ